MVDRENLVYRASKYTYSFKIFQTIKTIGRDIHNGEITLNESNEDQGNWIMKFKKKTKPQDLHIKQQKKVFLKTHLHFLKVEKMFLMLFKVKFSQ